MGQAASDGPSDNLGNLGEEIIRQTRSFTELATLSYKDFTTCLSELNALCSSIVDSRGRRLVFAVKKGTDSSVFWKNTIRIACIRVDVRTNKIESYKLLTLGQLLKVAHTLQGHRDAAAQSSPSGVSYPQDVFSSSVLLEASSETGEGLGESLGECCICLERKPDVILPCAHSYCLPCIEQWYENHRTCPICRETLDSTDDSWVISEAPDSEEISQEIQKSLINLSGS